jgi:phosphinothricin acetyltransferase
MMFETITEENYSHVSSIYEEGLATGISSFETVSPKWDKWDATHHPFGRLLLKIDNNYIGWVALSPTSQRYAYRGVAELSLYIGKEFKGKGFGDVLMKKIIEICEKSGIWTIHAGIFRENAASRKLHVKHGFREIGFREKVAQRNGKWHDNFIYERRSKTIGL